KLNSNRALIKAPTKPPSSYALFVKSVAVPLIEGQPASIAERSRLYAEKWRQTGEAEKQRLQDKVVALRAEHEEAARKWWQSADPELVALENRRRKRQRGDKARLLKNPFAPKRPISAYVAFAKEHAQLNKGAADGGIGGMAKVMSAGAAKWKAMSAAAKEPYAQQAATDKIRYEQEVIKYYGRAM
ncbi:Non-histone chromosomal protein 6, partial [Coemansia spiralis]